jgi:hypothetical protein
LESGVVVSRGVTAVHQKLVRTRSGAHTKLVGRACAMGVAFNNFEAPDRSESNHAHQASKHVAFFKLSPLCHFCLNLHKALLEKKVLILFPQPKKT